MPILETSNMLIRLHHNILTSVNAVQGDTGRMWHFIIDDYEIPLDAEVRMYVKKPSGKEIYNPAIVEEQTVSFQPTLQTLAEIGQSIGQIQILSNGQSVSTFPFFLNVEKNYILSSEIISKDELLILDELITYARTTLAEMKALIKTVTTQETARVEAEKKRVSAEIKRDEEEKLRQQNTTTAITNANNAENKANEAANNANTKATLANDAAANANNKASLANTAAINANSKATLANNAATNADQKANLANQAATNADNKAALANTAATNANEKANLANVATTNANNAATNANNKASLANTATSNATAAAKSANDAAAKAIEATKGLEGAVSGMINDNVASGTSTYSSNKINSLISAHNIIAITNSQIDSLKSL